MKKRILSLILCVLCAFSLFGACSKSDSRDLIELPIAEINPDITKPKGEFYTANGDELYASGGLSALGNEFVRIMIDGKEYEFEMSDEVIKKIGIFNKDKDDLKIKRGTMITLRYRIDGKKYFAEDIEIVTAN